MIDVGGRLRGPWRFTARATYHKESAPNMRTVTSTSLLLLGRVRMVIAVAFVPRRPSALVDFGRQYLRVPLVRELPKEGRPSPQSKKLRPVYVAKRARSSPKGQLGLFT